MIVLADSSNLIGLYVCLGIFVAVLALIIAIAIINSLRNKRVLASSPYIASILELNKKYKFETILDPNEVASIPLNSKKSFDNFNVEKRFDSLISDRLPHFQSRLKEVEHNIEAYSLYKKELASIPLTSDEALAKKCHMPLKSFQERELRLGERFLMHPTTDYSLEMKWHYTSPAGRNYYSNSRSYSYRDVKSAVTRLTPVPKAPKKAKTEVKPKEKVEPIETSVEEVE